MRDDAAIQAYAAQLRKTYPAIPECLDIRTRKPDARSTFGGIDAGGCAVLYLSPTAKPGKTLAHEIAHALHKNADGSFHPDPLDTVLPAFWEVMRYEVSLEDAWARCAREGNPWGLRPHEHLAEAIAYVVTGLRVAKAGGMWAEYGGNLTARRFDVDLFFRSVRRARRTVIAPPVVVPVVAPAPAPPRAAVVVEADELEGELHDDPIGHVLGFAVSRGFGVVTPGLERFGRHTGTDFRLPAGTAVYAIGAGTVVVDDDDARYDPADSRTWSGVSVTMRLDRDGSLVTDAHLTHNAVESDQRVVAGQLIGMSGTTGASTGPHLHREIRLVTGELVDPIAYMHALREEDDMADEETKQILREIRDTLAELTGSTLAFQKGTFPELLDRLGDRRDVATGAPEPIKTTGG